ncbi:MAG: YjbH domain-containing protein [Fibrobacteres bacterium]|nr:YjbH domain-containing protein [Fibrobacterota bacterium]
MRIAVAAALLAFLLITNAVGGSAPIQPIRLVDQPTAGTYGKGQYGLGINFFDEGGIAYSFGLGITDRFSLGVAHQIMGAIGSGKPKLQSIPGVQLKYRIVEESYYLPGMAIGLETQGTGNYYNKRDGDNYLRFQFKSKGLYGAISKSYLFLGQPLGFHFLANYSVVDNQADAESATIDGKPSNRIVDFAFGIDKSFNEELSVLAEYDFALDDNHTRNIGKGYLNAAIRWMIFPSFTLEVAVKDMLLNKELPVSTDGVLREVRIFYTNKF